MVKTILIDDEIHNLETLKWKLENYCPEVKVVEMFSDSIQALEYLKANTPDLVFLDIEMPLLNGFDILEELDEINFDIIFATAYDDFGIKAIKFSALDYLLKPIQNQELQNAVRKHIDGGKKPSSSQIEELFKNIEKEKSAKKPDRIGLSTKESIEFVDPEDIIVCASESNYTLIYLSDGRKKLISRTLKDFENLLMPYNFFRPHHSFLVNLNHVKEYIRADGGHLNMSNNKKIPISRSKREDLLKRLQFLIR